MPSHIFVRLGMWPETVESNLLSVSAAERDKMAPPCQSRGNELHAMHFLQFAYLQLGYRTKAKEVADRALHLPTISDPTGESGAGALPGPNCESGEYVAASYALDAHDWEMANSLPADDKTDDDTIWLAVGEGAARTGNLARARQAEQGLARWRDEASKTRHSACCDAPRLIVAAWIAEAEQHYAQALQLMQQAAAEGMQADESSWIYPPSSEQLGDLLLQQHKPTEALAAYRKELQGTPDLFNALYGAALAAEAGGDAATAGSYFRKVSEIASQGDRPEVAVARRKARQIKATGTGNP